MGYYVVIALALFASALLFGAAFAKAAGKPTPRPVEVPFA